MAKRKSTGKRQRFNIFKRDKFTCQYCGRTPPTVVLVVDHILPVSKGGGEEDTNKTTSCEACNQGKADGLLSVAPRPIDATLESEVERQEQLREYNLFLLQVREGTTRLATAIGTYWNDLLNPETAGQYTFSAERMGSIRTFLKHLPAAEIYDAIDIAFSRRPPTKSTGYDQNTFKYFCGVCWSKIKERRGGEAE